MLNQESPAFRRGEEVKVVAVMDGIAVLLIVVGALLTLAGLVSEPRGTPGVGMTGVLLIAFGVVWLVALIVVGALL